MLGVETKLITSSWLKLNGFTEFEQDYIKLVPHSEHRTDLTLAYNGYVAGTTGYRLKANLGNTLGHRVTLGKDFIDRQEVIDLWKGLTGEELEPYFEDEEEQCLACHR